jgi:hypothetical protein
MKIIIIDYYLTVFIFNLKSRKVSIIRLQYGILHVGVFLGKYFTYVNVSSSVPTREVIP